MILADIGNRYAHVCQDDKVEHLLLDEAVRKYDAEEVYYISVRDDGEDILSDAKNWIDISDRLHIDGEYDGMGIDRKTLCLSHKNGIFIDAGSAITVDRVESGLYQGGFIIPGIHTYRESFARISPILNHEIDRAISLEGLPKNTPDSVSFGVIMPIVASIEKISNQLPLYFTGGDGEWLHRHFDNSIYDEGLVFKGMRRVVC